MSTSQTPPGAECIVATIEEADVSTTFDLIVPTIVPPDYQLDGVALEPPSPIGGPEASCENAKRASIYFASTREDDTPPIMLIEAVASPNSTPDPDTETVTINEQPVSKRVVARGDGSVLVTYEWQIDDIALTLMTIMTEAVTEEALEEMIGSMVS